MRGPGFLFMFGVYGTKPTRDTVELFKRTGAASVLLLGRNIETPAQTKAFCEELVQRVGRPLLFAIDHEGGWVLRFKSGVTAFPGNAALGRAADPRLSYATGEHMARELLALGIQLNLAPVVDVLTGKYNPGIGIRSFGSDPKAVSRLGASFIRGMQDHGVSACAKHFPGKGAATVDAHVQMPTIRIPKTEFSRVHLAPFAAAIKAGAHCVMTSHVRYPALDKEIATFSRPITRDILRKRLGFKGVVISDDLCMGAVTGAIPVQLAAVRSIQAGHDLLIIAHDKAAMAESAELLDGALADGLIEEKEIAASVRRVEHLLSMKRSAKKPDAGKARALSRSVADRAVEVVRRGALALPLPTRATLVLFPDFREVRDRFTFEGGTEAPARLLRGLLPGSKFVNAPVASAKLGSIASEVRRAERVVFFCFEALRFPGQRAALDLLNRIAPEKTAVCLIRSSSDLRLLDRRMTTLDCAGYRNSQLAAAVSSLRGTFTKPK